MADLIDISDYMVTQPRAPGIDHKSCNEVNKRLESIFAIFKESKKEPKVKIPNPACPHIKTRSDFTVIGG